MAKSENRKWPKKKTENGQKENRKWPKKKIQIGQKTECEKGKRKKQNLKDRVKIENLKCAKS